MIPLPQPYRDAPEKQLIGLEALRFLSAFAILVWHYQQFLFVGAAPVGLVVDRQPFFGLLRPFYEYGYSGVELFWCISGFIFAWKYAGVIRARFISLTKFLFLRFSRLYPLHLATLAIVAMLNFVYLQQNGQFFVYVFNDLRHFLLNLMFASGWGLESGYSFNGPVWSVSAEILVYLLFFLVCRYAGSNLWLDVAMAIVLSLASLQLRKMFGFKSQVLGAGVFFYLGCVSHHLYALMLRTTTRSIRRAISALLVLLVVVLAGLVYLKILRIAGASIAMFPAIVLLFQVAIKPRSASVTRALTILGDLTYASYLMHFPIQLAFVLVFGLVGVPIIGVFYGHVLFLCYIATTLIVARFVFVYFERPAQRYLRALLPARPATRSELEPALTR